jgi:glycine betaine/proline transport system ATP-binding protein
MVFQNMALLPHRSVRDNIGFALELRGMDGYTRAQLADQALETVSLHGYGDRLPSELSGGDATARGPCACFGRGS